MGLGKTRTKLGAFIDKRGIKQDWLITNAKLSKGTITSVCNDTSYIPSGNTMQKIIKALRDVDTSVRADQFWDL